VYRDFNVSESKTLVVLGDIYCAVNLLIIASIS